MELNSRSSNLLPFILHYTMTNDAITSVIAASASAVGKVFVIGAIGYISAIRPRPVPILPPHAMNAISKMNFNLVSLQYSNERCVLIL